MDYFGQLVDDLTDLYEAIEASPESVDATEVLRALQRVMLAAAKTERLRVERARAMQAVEDAEALLRQDKAA